MLWLPLLLTALAAAAVVTVTKRREPSRGDWILVAMAVPALFLFFLRATDAVVLMLSDFWCFIRLMPAIALTRGYRLYYPDGEGPLLGWSYGPVMPCLQLPLGALPDPIRAVLAAGILNEIVLFLPLLLLVWRVLPATASRPAVGILIVGALHALMLHSLPAVYWMQGIQVDTFAMGLASLGFWILLGAGRSAPVTRARIATAAVFFAAAVFSKQNELFVLAVPVAVLWARDGRSGALSMTLALALAGALGLGLCLAAVGWEALFLNLWLVPAKHPLLEPGAGIVALVALEFLGHASGLLAAFIALALLWRRLAPSSATARDWILGRPWILPAAAALLMFPMSVMGKVKIGGADNSNHSVYYLAATVGLLAAGLAAGESRRLQRGIPAFALALVLALNAAKGVDTRSFAERREASLLNREYRFAQQHPGEVWFSADPLVTLYTDGKLYHHGSGVYDRTLPKLTPTPAHLREHLPANLRWVSCPGYIFWMPEGLRPVPDPGVGAFSWYEVPR